jgi:ribonuclease J
MTSLTFYGGVNEIGGNKILVEDKDTRIFLDFGQSFSHLDEYFVDWLQPRVRFELRDYFALGLMPRLNGLYSKTALEPTEIRYVEPEYNAVFISHPHFDHTAHLAYLDPHIPLYMGETCKTILSSTQDTTKSFFFSEEDEVEKDGTVVAEKNDLHTFRTGDKVKVDGMTVTPIHVDHSVPGAYGFIVETSGGTVAYTGDLRQHGAKPEMTEDFLEAAEGADALVIEGTRVSPKETRKNHTEKIVYEGSKKVCAGAKGLVIAMRYPKDMDRFRTFHTAAMETGKTLVVSAKTAHLLLSLKGDPIGLPDPLKDKHIRIYSREMKKYQKWETELKPDCIGWDWVKAHQKEVIWELDFNQLTELVDVEPKCGECIHSMSEPFNEDPSSQLQDEVLHNWTDRFAMGYHQLHASGHASKDEIFSMVKEINAKKLFPVHTEHLRMFKGAQKIRVGKEYTI